MSKYTIKTSKRDGTIVTCADGFKFKYDQPLLALDFELEAKLSTAEQLARESILTEAQRIVQTNLHKFQMPIGTLKLSQWPKKLTDKRIQYTDLYIKRAPNGTRPYVNQKFGKLTGRAAVGQDKNHRLLIRCDCECGREVITRLDALYSGHATTCKQCVVDKRSQIPQATKDIIYDFFKKR